MTLPDKPEGLEILQFIPGDETVFTQRDPNIPFTLTMIIAFHQNKWVLIYNYNRQQWECPGGGIEIDESPRDCAVRELMEESSQIADELICKGIFRIRLISSGIEEYGVAYRAEIKTLRPFIPNDETNALQLWDENTVLDAPISRMSRQLLEYCR